MKKIYMHNRECNIWKEGGPTIKMGQQGRQAKSIEVSALTPHIGAAATNRTNINNKTGNTGY
jgi:hypothetical protein